VNARARRSTPEQLARALRGDLDTIVLAALRREPERRYPSVERLAADVRAHLDRLPVSARRDTLAYRASKFVRRHALASSFAGLALVSLVAGVAVLAGVVTTGFLRHALRTIDAERARLFEAQSVDSLRINRIEDGISAARNAMKAILDPAAAVAPDALRLDELARWLAGPEGGDPVRGDLEPLLARSTA